uniref:Retrotransposon protein, putative, unclassified n=1 Tax=Oryza sativa subsp. japonica TaxID=39947 RepID=Q2QWP6_ORYSJ|nr:retrotransposon protein, putative, unclassified [Oryza sativa Japonica Group]
MDDEKKSNKPKPSNETFKHELDLSFSFISSRAGIENGQNQQLRLSFILVGMLFLKCVCVDGWYRDYGILHGMGIVGTRVYARLSCHRLGGIDNQLVDDGRVVFLLEYKLVEIRDDTRSLPCHLEGNNVDILYNPTVGVNLISESFAFAYLGDKAITPTNKFFKHSNENIIEGFGIVQDNEYAEEVTAVPPNKSPKTLLENEVLDFIKEEAELGATLELPIMELPPRTPLELKPLPEGLHYAFLHNDKEAHVIISDKLYEDETQRLLSVLEKHCAVLGYSLQDLRGINPILCTHRIPIEHESTPSREPQRRLNNVLREVVKKDVLKLLHAGIIYSVPYSEWVSPVQVMPKKRGLTDVANAQNELIPQRTVTGWRMCIDYRKLHKATKKDHFPLPSIDEMLERLANRSFFCFLVGYSGCHQIPIHPEDQM